jgi:cytosine/adenosine deaminase-related metal-dependent hydrolase
MADTTPTILVGGVVLTVDSDRRVLDPGAVAVRDDRIVDVGERDQILETYGEGDRVDLEDSLLLPGLIDSHGHSGHGLTKSLADGRDWTNLVDEIYFRASDEEFWRAEGYLSALEQLEFGVTTSISMSASKPRVDDPRYAVAASEGYADLGLRHVVGLGPPDPPHPRVCRDPHTGEEIHVDLDRAMRTTREAIDAIDGTADGRLSVFVAPSNVVPEVDDGGETVITSYAGDDRFMPEFAGVSDPVASAYSVEMMQRVADLAVDADTGIQTHCHEGMVEAAANAVPEILSSRLSLAHCAGTTLEEIEILADNDVSVTHAPLANAFALSRFPLIEALDAGVNVSVATDGSAPDRSFDLLWQGRVAAQLQRAHFGDDSLLPAGKVVEMLTIDAARALGMEDEVGSLEPGKKADVVALDLDSARLRPRYMYTQRVADYASGLDVGFVMVNGEVLMEDRLFEEVPVDEILADAERAAAVTYERADTGEYLDEPENLWNATRY